MTTVYKFVKVEGYQLVSLHVSGPLKVVYTPGEVIRPTIGGLLAYSRLLMPRMLRTEIEIQVWEGQAELTDLPSYRLDTLLRCLNKRDVARLWRKKTPDYTSFCWPMDTVACRELTLIRRLL